MNTTEFIEPDVAVIGSGSAGASAALHCARRGMDVLCIDRRDLDRTGARWANNIPSWMFDAADIAAPEPPEKLGDPTPVHLLAGRGPRRITIEDHGCIEVDMRRLVERLRHQATDAGVRFAGQVDLQGFDGDVLSTSTGPIRARWYIDASGLGGAGLIELPRPKRTDICTAAQQVHRITDGGEARRFFEDHGVPYGDTLCFGGLYGGYSVIHVRAHGFRKVHILTGSIPGRDNPSGRRILSEFVDTHSDWIGARKYGGASPIPLGRPVDRLAKGRVAVVGDAAVQVLSAHGSGVGAGLVASRVLADALADGDGLHGYATRWQRRYGGLLAAYDIFRRFICELSVDELAVMMESNLLHPHIASLSLRQVTPIPRRLFLPSPRPLRKAPRLVPSLGITLSKMVRTALVYRRYPSDPDRIPEWTSKLEDIFDGSGPVATSPSLALRT